MERFFGKPFVGARQAGFGRDISLCLLTIAACGCQMAGLGYRPSPLSAAQQRQEIEKIAPPGTPREEVERRLKAAGIEISAGSSPHLAYCDLWNRSGGGRWMMNIALMFDESGKLIGTRPAQAETGVYSESEADSTIIADARERDRSGSPMRDSTVVQAGAEQTASSGRPLSSNPADRRTPFPDPKPTYAP